MVPVNGNDHLLHSPNLIPFGKPKLPKHHLQLFRRYEPIAVLIEDLEGLRQIRLLLLRGLVPRVGPEERVVQRSVERDEVLEAERVVAGLDVGDDGGLELGDVGLEAQAGEGLADFLGGDHAVAVLVEDVEDAAEAEGVEAGGGPEAEGRRGGLVREAADYGG